MTTREDLRSASQIALADAAVAIVVANRMVKHEDSKGSTDHHVRAHPGMAESEGRPSRGPAWGNEEVGEQPHEEPLPPGTGSLAPHNRAYLMERLESVGLEETLSDWANDEVGGFSDSEGKGLGNVAVEELPEMASKFAEETGTDQEMIQTLLERFHTEDTEDVEGAEAEEDERRADDPSTEIDTDGWSDSDWEAYEEATGNQEKKPRLGSEPVADPNEPQDAAPSDPYGMDYSDPLRNAVTKATVESTATVLALHQDSHGSTDHHQGGGKPSPRGGKGYRAYRGERGRERGSTSQDDPSQQSGGEAYGNERAAERGGNWGPGTEGPSKKIDPAAMKDAVKTLDVGWMDASDQGELVAEHLGIDPEASIKFFETSRNRREGARSRGTPKNYVHYD